MERKEIVKNRHEESQLWPQLEGKTISKVYTSKKTPQFSAEYSYLFEFDDGSSFCLSSRRPEDFVCGEFICAPDENV